MTEQYARQTDDARSWRTSSYSSGGNGTCVEVGTNAAAIAIRDTTDRDGPTLWFDRTDWIGFTTNL